jgi:uncharacterized protein
MMMAFASIDPHKGKMGAREARNLIEAGIVKVGDQKIALSV